MGGSSLVLEPNPRFSSPPRSLFRSDWSVKNALSLSPRLSLPTVQFVVVSVSNDADGGSEFPLLSLAACCAIHV